MLDMIGVAALDQIERELIKYEPDLEPLVLEQVKLLLDVLLNYIERKRQKFAQDTESEFNLQGDSNGQDEDAQRT